MLPAMSDDNDPTADDFDDYAASVASRRLARGDQTAEQHQAEAIEVLRDMLDDPHTRPADRLRAATDLAKLTSGPLVAPPRSIMQYSDDELMQFVIAARRERGANADTPGGSLESGTFPVPSDARVPAPGESGVPDGFPFEQDDADVLDALEAALAGVADKTDYSDLM